MVMRVTRAWTAGNSSATTMSGIERANRPNSDMRLSIMKRAASGAGASASELPNLANDRKPNLGTNRQDEHGFKAVYPGPTEAKLLPFLRALFDRHGIRRRGDAAFDVQRHGNQHEFVAAIAGAIL